MKRFIFLMAGCWAFSTVLAQPVTRATLDLQNVVDDKVQVSVELPSVKKHKLVYYIPKTVPGTYSTDDFGRFVAGFKAEDKKGNPLVVEQSSLNSWTIVGAEQLAKISYWVNDTYDIESQHEVFSPVGSNIEAGKNFMLNMQAFVGYCTEFMEQPYELTVLHPDVLWGATSMTDQDPSLQSDRFTATRYADLVEHPILYSIPDFTRFTIQDMEILVAVYSPSGKVKAQDITPDLQKMMTAQKQFLGSFNSTRTYAVLLYLSSMSKDDARGFGALEHPTCTTVVMPEMLGKAMLEEQLRDVVSHEFFHIVTPLNLHANQIHYFDFNDPKMSQHLWLYEGVTEYFANLFQVQQGLITEQDFLNRMSSKMGHAARMNDTMPFTKMSERVLSSPYKEQYVNVYEKGALIGMCLDIIIREKSEGKRGILDLVRQLSERYGKDKPFEDSALFGEITALTYPEVGAFLQRYVAGPEPIPYADYLARMGVVPDHPEQPTRKYHVLEQENTSLRAAWLKG